MARKYAVSVGDQSAGKGVFT